MDPSRFRDREGEFPILDLVASFAFKSSSSIAFLLGRYTDTLRLTEIDLPLGPGSVFEVIGRVDVHHPCEGHIKAQLHVLLPAEYHGFERVKELTRVVFEALSIPPDETYESLFVVAERETCFENATDRDGMSDRMD